MPDREKVINCLTDLENIMITRQEICPSEELQYWIELQEGVADAIAMLKQETVVMCKDCKYGEPWGVLIGCGTTKGFGITHDPDWFCADGEQKDSE